ncbi:Ivy family c-type lysozyme inhibitor [Dyella soli]|uniref:C-lysozyme inhibitor n=1 Tax=Dyella soli TaxID=522319 RepID=A0A4R0YW08_9GAMM|nr:Ivy family c-type lysozyme inhibitor [Dyella soli]TCI10540.1 hypothetical protein EZM97_16875 [Dyella soli]
MDRRYALVLVISVACVACSQPHGAASPSAGPAAHATSVAASHIARTGPQYLRDLLQHPDFASAFVALSGADQLPPWTRQGGTSTPAQRVELEGRAWWLATACKPHDCPSERILVLYDENTHAMSGLFARRKPGEPSDVDSNDPANDDWIWLGAPDDAAKQLLQQKLYSPD